MSHLAHLHKLAMTQNAETSFRFERAQSAKWSQLARNRGDPEAIKNDLRALNRESLAQCASDQLTESNERKKGYGQKKQSKAATSAYSKRGETQPLTKPPSGCEGQLWKSSPPRARGIVSSKRAVQTGSRK